VYCAATGFGDGGRYGPLPSMAGFSQAMAGYYSITGPEDGPGERPRTQVIDFTSPLTVVQAIMLGLMTREQTGESQWVHCSQMRTLISLSQVRSAEYFASGEVPKPWGSASPYAVPSQAFRTADKYVMVDCRDDEDWRRFCDAIELPALADDERFATNASRVAHRETLLPMLERAMVRFSGDRWLAKFRAAGVPCGPVNVDIEDVFEDPQVIANELIVERTHEEIPFPVKTTPVPWSFSRTPAVYGPLQGPLDEHRASVLADLARASAE
jgi:crotonobetainyl-CoA:carnitine CoA-transferase CaiB-like acyl-CoA transferase